MIQLKISGAYFDDIIAYLETLEHPDLRPLAEDVKGIMVQDNRQMMLAQTDIFGDRVDDVEQSTIKRGRGGDGPPRVPRGEESRMIADYEVDVQETTNGYLLSGEWPNTPFVHFHSTGTKHMVARDPVGISPDGLEKIAAVTQEFAETLVSRGMP